MSLTLRRTLPDERPRNDWVVLDDSVIVGRIYENDSTPNPESRWFWALNGAAGEALQHGILRQRAGTEPGRRQGGMAREL
jgi:hypothetical protein